jgi:pyridoxal phosphate enzyme (YggS family)
MIAANIEKIRQQIPSHVKLIAVSKTKPIEMLHEAYAAQQRAFGENKVQEVVNKYPLMPLDTEWHLIGHLQTNKVKYIAPFIHLIHAVDSIKLLETINKEALKNNRVINVLLQVYIAKEETKFGLSNEEVLELLTYAYEHQLNNINICGLMGMATYTENKQQIEQEFENLYQFFNAIKLQIERYPVLKKETFIELSMGMSSDYELAIKHGSTMIRVGSNIFGER